MFGPTKFWDGERRGHTPSGGRQVIEEAPGKRESGLKSCEGIQQVPGPEANGEVQTRKTVPKSSEAECCSDD